MKTMLRCLLALVCAGSAGASALDDDDKKPVPLYTNEDLRRVSPYRDETGVRSKPAAAPAPETATARDRGRGEEYWRREAERLRDRLRPLRERASELQFQIEEKRQQPPRRRGGVDPQIGTRERRLRALEERIREAESRFEDRARRERALPGWLR
ncbi:MAG TPA: hypothetical protein VNH43_09410 [Vicinamibacteria bacterium]|nr:hypothetical protein [Vicinamibacteria bacterium]